MPNSRTRLETGPLPSRTPSSWIRRFPRFRPSPRPTSRTTPQRLRGRQAKRATSRVEYGTTKTYGQSTVLDPSLITAHIVPVTGLAPQTTYNYRVRSIDQAGNERIGSNATFQTLAGPDTTPPSAPVLLPAVFASATQLQLSWTASTDNVAVTGYNVYRDGILIASVGGTSVHRHNARPAGNLHVHSRCTRCSAKQLAAIERGHRHRARADYHRYHRQRHHVDERNHLMDDGCPRHDRGRLWHDERVRIVHDGDSCPHHGAFADAHRTDCEHHVSLRSGVRRRRRSSRHISRQRLRDQPGGQSGVFQNEILISG